MTNTRINILFIYIKNFYEIYIWGLVLHPQTPLTFLLIFMTLHTIRRNEINLECINLFPDFYSALDPMKIKVSF